ncbi:MAG: VRR-NUC domain-containing protein [bacterium]|nr:VRR-NUC domain-containing protein [bacterium]
MPASRPRPPVLPEGYYVSNFEIVVETVVERYRDLLHPDELAFRDDFHALSLAARRLYVRLISRKGPCFRRDRIDYPEIHSVDDAIRELEAAGFLDHGADLDARDLLVLMLRGELREMTGELVGDNAPAAARKEELVALLSENVGEVELGRAVRERSEIVQPLHHPHLLTFRLLFFGNLSQDWTEFVLRDLGVVRYEPYELRRGLRLFPTRPALDDTLILRRTRRLVGLHLAAGETAPAVELAQAVVDGIDRWHPSTRWLADRILNKVGRALERAAEPAPALRFYEAALSPPARERRARVLVQLGREQEALALCEEIRDQPRDESEAVFAPRFAHRLRRRRGEPLRPPARPPRRRIEMRFAKKDDEPVEQLVLAALATAGRQGVFAENRLWKALFGLAFWDILFAPVEGAFQHPFQFGPLDLDSPGFRQARAELIAERLAELRADPRPGPRLLAVYDAKCDTANRLVAWHEELRSGLELALSRLSGPHLALVCDRLSRDIGRYRRGFPDLFVLRDEDPGFELYEVKAPGDQLRPEQGAWIDYLDAGGIPASILQVRWSGGSA